MSVSIRLTIYEFYSSFTDITKDMPSSLWQLMAAYISLGLLGFCLVLLCLDKIGAKVEPEKTGYQVPSVIIAISFISRTMYEVLYIFTFSVRLSEQPFFP